MCTESDRGSVNLGSAWPVASVVGPIIAGGEGVIVEFLRVTNLGRTHVCVIETRNQSFPLHLLLIYVIKFTPDFILSISNYQALSSPCKTARNLPNFNGNVTLCDHFVSYVRPHRLRHRLHEVQPTPFFDFSFVSCVWLPFLSIIGLHWIKTCLLNKEWNSAILFMTTATHIQALLSLPITYDRSLSFLHVH